MTLHELIIEVQDIDRGKSAQLSRPGAVLQFLKEMEENTKKSLEWHQKIARAHYEDRERAEEKLKAIHAVLIAAGISDYTDDLPKMLEDFLGATTQQIQETENELIAVKAYLSEVEADRARLQSLISSSLDNAGMPQDLDVAVRLNFLVAQSLLDRRNVEKLTGGGK